MVRMSRVSVCVCTMDRPDDLEVALRSVRAGSAQPHELIVSDDGAGTAREIAARFEATYVEGPRAGLSANRNCAIDAASGELIAFIDDDVVVSPEFVALASRAQPDVVTTGWELNFDSDPPRRVTPHNASFLGFQNVPPGGDLRSIVINATLFPATLFAQARFDEEIKYGYDELDMARHARALGWRISFADELWVEHHPSSLNRAAYERSIDAARIYTTFKAYRDYDRNALKATSFAAIAALHHVSVYAWKRRPVRDAVSHIAKARAMRRDANSR